MPVPKAIICDLDGTLALLNERDRYDPTSGDDMLNYPIAHILQVYDNQTIMPVDLLLLTGREETYREYTVQWLHKNGITHYKQLYMRPAGDYRRDFMVKREIYENRIKHAYEVLFVLEDRDQVVRMWRDLGLTCLQVAYGDY